VRVIPDERGRLMEIMRSDQPPFTEFGQVYMTTAYPGVVKGWHYHHEQDDNMTVVKGMVKLVLYDRRPASPTAGQVEEIIMGEHRPLLVHIPREVAHGFKNIGTEEAIIVNLVTRPYNYTEPDEYRIAPHGGEIPYDWSRQDG
jgi:dTDP-4-dehydrorhamnose 3,5-epimerase